MDYTSTYEKVWKLIKKNALRTISFTESDYLYFDDNKKDDIYNEYERLRTVLRDRHFPDDNSVLIDRHKIAACFAGAILKCEPIKKKEGEIEGRQNTIFYLPNEFLAVTASVDIVYSFNKEKSSSGFIYPYNQNDNYVAWLCYSLHDSNADNENFNSLMYANILFLLESYNDIAE